MVASSRDPDGCRGAWYADMVLVAGGTDSDQTDLWLASKALSPSTDGCIPLPSHAGNFAEEKTLVARLLPTSLLILSQATSTLRFAASTFCFSLRTRSAIPPMICSEAARGQLFQGVMGRRQGKERNRERERERERWREEKEKEKDKDKDKEKEKEGRERERENGDAATLVSARYPLPFRFVRDSA
jgi:hypothetical protein